MIVGIVPARGGSKGIHRKNLTLLHGLPLLSYTLRAASEARMLDDVMVSTDDDEVAAVARAEGIPTPFRRPAELATDTSPITDVLLHAIAWRNNRGLPTTTVVLLQPTSPMRTPMHIDAAINIYTERRAGSVVSVLRVPHRFTPHSLFKQVNGELIPLFNNAPAARRQDKPELFARNGPAVLVVGAASIAAHGLYVPPCIGMEMTEEDSVDVDTPDDLKRAELLLRNRQASKEAESRPRN